MSLDKYIRISLINLSKIYKITIVELTVAKNGKISKTYRVSYEKIKDEYDFPSKREFKSKRELVGWLMCLQ